MSEQDNQDLKKPEVEITQETPAAPMGEWTQHEKYPVKQNSGYGMLLVIFCVVVIVLGYFLRQVGLKEQENNAATGGGSPPPITTTDSSS